MGNEAILNKSPGCDLPLSKLESSESHSILFSPDIRPGEAPHPYPESYIDKWDADHVRMPCSPSNTYTVTNSEGEIVNVSLWNLICQSLTAEIRTSKDLENEIMKYNPQYINKWKFNGLHNVINKHWTEDERQYFFDSLLPAMIKMALKLPEICTQPVPMLKQNKDQSVTLSQKQIACLLLNAFFCTFPKRNTNSYYEEHIQYPVINFNSLFFGLETYMSPVKHEKFKFLFNYFKRITSEEPTGTVTFHRQVFKPENFPSWNSSTSALRTAVVKSEGRIEREGQGMLQVDFADEYIGGLVLTTGVLQEEILFLIYPELIVSRLFTERMEKNEAVIFTGAERYNKYSGYNYSLKWAGDFRDNTPRDSWGRRCTKIAAIDAIPFSHSEAQFDVKNIERDLNKAYCGFYENAPPAHLPAVATGNWGCGAFGGSPDLKFLIQWMAASECGRDLLYFTFTGKKLEKKLKEMSEFLSTKKMTVGELWRLLINYVNFIKGNKTGKRIDLYDHIYSVCNGKEFSIIRNEK